LAPGYSSYNKAEPTASLNPTKSLQVLQNGPELKLKSLNIEGQMPRTNQNEESDEGQSQDDLDEELIPMFTFRKLNNRRGNHSSIGRLGNFNWPWFGKKI